VYLLALRVKAIERAGAGPEAKKGGGAYFEGCFFRRGHGFPNGSLLPAPSDSARGERHAKPTKAQSAKTQFIISRDSSGFFGFSIACYSMDAPVHGRT
jgi:hypothetical protein